MAAFQLLLQLPEELLQEILQRLDRDTLINLNLASRWCYQKATPLIWREVVLQDRHSGADDNHIDQEDHHDDTPLLRKLAIVYGNPWIGSCIHTVIHRCNLPPPAIFHELPRMTFNGPSLSTDLRTVELIKGAVQNMSNVSTLRIIFGHSNINDALVRCFFDKYRKPSIRRLWLENCRISAACDTTLYKSPVGLPLELDFSGLESIRFRRLPIRPGLPIGTEIPPFLFSSTRGCQGDFNFQDGAGGPYQPPINDAGVELRMSIAASEDSEVNPKEFDQNVANTFAFSEQRDATIWEDLVRDANLPPTDWKREKDGDRAFALVDRGPWLDPDSVKGHIELACLKTQREWKPSSHVMVDVLYSCSATLTHLCLDWVFTKQYYEYTTARRETYQNLFALRFPHLKSFQYRNAVVQDTALPADLFLLDYSKRHDAVMTLDEETGKEFSGICETFSLYALEFIEAHPKLQCLAWPMESFFSSRPREDELARRVEAVVDHLGCTLTDLRVDTLYVRDGEPQSEYHSTSYDTRRRTQRRRFISEFAAKMTKVESIKIEGGVPRDERREVIRALHQCPLEKIVMIGVCCPIGNTWGQAGRDLDQSLDAEDLDILEAEDKHAIESLAFKDPTPVQADFRFEAEYGWPASPPMIHTIASFHAKTIRRLKFCGYKGSPILFTPTRITHPLLAPLKHFHNLESLALSVWLKTEFEEADRDEEIINYWLDARNPASKSLVRITDEEPEGWEKELRTKYSPVAMAWWVTAFIGGFLSEEAKARKGGVHVRVTLCIGDWGGMFDVDLHIGKGSLNSDICLGFQGPREELEPERRRYKLENRRWF